jgi:hypothetical protein
MAQLVLEGTWEEIVLQADRFSGRRVRLIILGSEDALAENGAPRDSAASEDRSRGLSTQTNAPAEGESETLAQALAGRTGRISFGPPDLSERVSEAFGELVAEKHRQENGR